MLRNGRCACLGVVAFLLLRLAPGTGQVAAADLTKDDIDFRKNVYVDKAGHRLPYRLFVPLGYDANRKYPLLLWLHGGKARGSDNVRQLTNESQLGTHYWISNGVQREFPVFVMAPQCPSDEVWAEPELNQPGPALKLAMEALAKVQKEFSIDPDRIYVAGQSMGAMGAWSVLQAYRGKWAAAMIMAAYDNFTNVGAIAQVPLWVFQGDADEAVPVSMVRDMMQQLKRRMPMCGTPSTTRSITRFGIKRLRNPACCRGFRHRNAVPQAKAKLALAGSRQSRIIEG